MAAPFGFAFGAAGLQPRLSPRESPPTCCGRGRSGVCAGIAIVGIGLSSSALRSTFTLRILQSRSALTTCCARARRDGIFDGRLIGINCRGAEKVARLEKLIGGFDGHQIFAYGDSDGDREMLRWPIFRFTGHSVGAMTCLARVWAGRG